MEGHRRAAVPQTAGDRVREGAEAGAMPAGSGLPVLAGCPECGYPAEVEHMATLGSTHGPAVHVRVRCVRRHWFLLLAEDVPGL